SSDVYLATVNGTRNGFTGSPSLVSSSAGVPSDFVRGPDGAIYYVADGSGEVRRLAALSTGVDSLITGKVLNLKTTSQNSVTAKSKDSSIDLGGGPGSTDDPTTAGNGGSVRIRSVAGGHRDNHPLPHGAAQRALEEAVATQGDRDKQ